MQWPVKIYRLVSEPSEPGLCCQRDGLTLAGIPLLVSDNGYFKPRPKAELQTILNVAYGLNSGLAAWDFLSGLQAVAQALNDGDLSRAMIAALLLKLPELDQGAVVRLRQAEPFLKANFNDLETRNHGRWATGGGSSLMPVQFVPSLPAPLLPPFPGLPGVTVPGSNADDDDFPYQSQSQDNGAVTDAERATADARARMRNEPKLCPPEGPEPDAKGRKMEQLLYQQQINGFPLGYDVTLNGTRYDGCDPLTGNMKEAKKVSGWFMTVSEEDRPLLNEYRKTMSQAFNQSTHAGGRQVDWYFSDEATGDYFAKQFEKDGLSNIVVHHEAYNPNPLLQRLCGFPRTFKTYWPSRISPLWGWSTS